MAANMGRILQALGAMLVCVLVSGCGIGGPTAFAGDYPPDFNFVVTPGSATIALGATQHFSAQVLHTNGTATPDAAGNYKWSSSNAAIATVDSNGTATAVNLGQVTITVIWKQDDRVRQFVILTVLAKSQAFSIEYATLDSLMLATPGGASYAVLMDHEHGEVMSFVRRGSDGPYAEVNTVGLARGAAPCWLAADQAAEVIYVLDCEAGQLYAVSFNPVAGFLRRRPQGDEHVLTPATWIAVQDDGSLVVGSKRLRKREHYAAKVKRESDTPPPELAQQ